MNKKYIIFGAGKDGREVYSHLNPDDIAYFCDNNNEKVGTKIYDIEVISFSSLLEIWRNYTIIVAVADKHFIRGQFERNGITEYIEYWDDAGKSNRIPNDAPQYIKKESKMNHMLDKYVSECDRISPLDDFHGFRELVIDLKKELNGQYAFYESAYNESMLYGHAKELMNYAGIKTDYANFPHVAHGIFFAGTHQDFHSAAIFPGMYDKKCHNKRFPYIPIFTVGPYIQYVQPVYTSEQMSKIKEKNGKTAVFFFTHSTEQGFVDYEEKKILDQVLNVYVKKYDTIYVCAYWCDIDKEIYSELAKKGIKVVSAGFRFDTEFMKRLRTILELGDDIYCYGFITTIVYALVLKKSLYVYDCGEKFDIRNVPSYIPFICLLYTDCYANITNIIFNKVRGSIETLSEDEKQILDLHFGLSIKKTPQEIKMIYEISHDIWNNCAHILKDYPIGVYRTYQQYQKAYDFEKLNILTQGLGKGFWNI